jgi:prepilin-type N-terminal cleavage/methylation domain-containing protein
VNKSNTRSQCGVTVLELLVVVAIIALLIAIAAPHLIAARRSAQEGRAIANLRTVAAAQMTLFARRQHFGSFELLFSGDYLLDGQFERGSSEGGPQGSSAEAITDGVYLYTSRFSRDARGVTLDADPIEANTATHHRFRFRLGRRTQGGAWANEGLLLVAPPSVVSPPARAYVPLNQ